MTVRYDPDLLQRLKKLNVRIRNSFIEKIAIFVQDPDNLKLNNHPLTREHLGHRSIDVTSDWRAIYKEITEGEEVVAYFVALGTHSQLYGKGRKTSK